MPQPVTPEPLANRAPLQQGAAAGGETESTAISSAASGTADRQTHHDAAPVASPPVSVSEPAGSAAPAETNRPFRAVTRAADQPAQTASAPASLAIATFGAPPEPTATTTAVSAPVAPAHAAPAAVTPPAAQIGSALLTLGPAADGSQQMTLRLHPAELGVVQVQIGRSETGAAHVEITAEKADTMQALLRDQPQLHRALDDAGVPAAGRTVTFHTAPVPTAAAAGNGSNSMSQNQSGTGTMNGNSPNGSGKGGYGGSEPGSDPGGRRQTRSSAEKMAAAGTISFRVGIDIVA
jgi:flagellar hook-length control protein FliK